MILFTRKTLTPDHGKKNHKKLAWGSHWSKSWNIIVLLPPPTCMVIVNWRPFLPAPAFWPSRLSVMCFCHNIDHYRIVYAVKTRLIAFLMRLAEVVPYLHNYFMCGYHFGKFCDWHLWDNDKQTNKTSETKLNKHKRVQPTQLPYRGSFACKRCEQWVVEDGVSTQES